MFLREENNLCISEFTFFGLAFVWRIILDYMCVVYELPKRDNYFVSFRLIGITQLNMIPETRCRDPTYS